MHYKDGTPARAGDIAKVTYVNEVSSGPRDNPVKHTRRTTYIGVVCEVVPGSDCCNASLKGGLCKIEDEGYGAHTYPVRDASSQCVELKKCEKVA